MKRGRGCRWKAGIGMTALPQPHPHGRPQETPLKMVTTLGVIDVDRSHLCAPPWAPGFPGTTGLGLPGLFS